jgi:hypothetical protein
VRRSLLLSFSLLFGCSGPESRSDAEPRPALPVVSGAAVDDTISAPPATVGDAEGEQPAVVFRCEEGRLGAYLVTTVAGDRGLFEEQMVPISLDSAPGC